MEFNLGGGSSLTPSTARSLMNNGYGWYMGFAPSPDNYYSILGVWMGPKLCMGRH